MFRLLRQNFPGLIFCIIGRKGWLCDEVHAQLVSGQYDGVIHHGLMAPASLQMELSSALFLIFPSVVEGWGLPPLEAMAAGVPVVASPAAACVEACGGAATHAHSIFDPADYVLAALELIASKEHYLARVQKGLDRCRDLSFHDYSKNIASLYQWHK